MAYNKGSITTKKIDSEIDFNKLVVIQMDRCNLALSQGAFLFSSSVLSFSCMLSHLRQRDDIYKKEMDELTKRHRISIGDIKNLKNNDSVYNEIKMKTAVNEYEILVRLCARHNLFPSKRGELNFDE